MKTKPTDPINPTKVNYKLHKDIKNGEPFTTK